MQTEPLKHSAVSISNSTSLRVTEPCLQARRVAILEGGAVSTICLPSDAKRRYLELYS